MRISKRAWLVVPVIGVLAMSGIDSASAASVTGLPSGTTAVSVTAGGNHAGVDALINAGGALKGKLTRKGSSAGIGSMSVVAVKSDKLTQAYGYTQSDGTFQIQSLNPGKYYVCAFSPFSPGSGAPYGYVPQCRGTTNAATGYVVPSGAKLSTVTAGHLTSGANLALPAAGAIAGAIKSANGKPLSGGSVSVYRGGKLVGSSYGNSGTYQVTGLPAAFGYKVCFNGAYAIGGPSKTGYLNECWRNVAWSATGGLGASAPRSATAVRVRPAKVTKGVNASLASAGAIAGTIKSSAAGHKRLQSSYVVAYSGGTFAALANSGANGTYLLKGLRASSSYRVCASGGSVHGSTTRFGARCFKSVAWNGAKPPNKAKTVSVQLGKTHGSVNLLLPPQRNNLGAIAGKVTGTGGVAIANVAVSVYKGSFVVGYGQTAPNGTYKVANLLASSSGYSVCFRGSNATSASTPDTGYASVCYRQKKWDGGTSLPSGTTHVSVRAGRTHTGVNATLGMGGEISGTIKLKSDNSALPFVPVYVLNSKHQIIGNGSSGFDGTYTVKGLTPNAGYTVCFAARQSYSTSSGGLGYLNQCYNKKNWYGDVGGGLSL